MIIRITTIITVLSIALACAAPQVLKPRTQTISETKAVETLLAPALKQFDDSIRVEVRLWDLTRVDMLTDDLAFEVDWAPKWAEGVGQALFYARMTEKRPALFILVKDLKKERHFLHRARIACDAGGVSLGIYDVARRRILSAPMYEVIPALPSGFGR